MGGVLIRVEERARMRRVVERREERGQGQAQYGAGIVNKTLETVGVVVACDVAMRRVLGGMEREKNEERQGRLLRMLQR